MTEIFLAWATASSIAATSKLLLFFWPFPRMFPYYFYNFDNVRVWSETEKERKDGENKDGEIERRMVRWTGRENGKTRKPDEQWEPHSYLINLVSLPLLCHFPWNRGSNDTLIHYPFILVIQRELLNNMLQIRPPTYNSFCHLQYIIWKTHSPLLYWPLFEDYCGWQLRDAARIWSIVFSGMWNYPDLSVIAKSTTSYSGPKERWNRFLSASLNERACKFMLMRAFCHLGSPFGAWFVLYDNLAV